MTRFYYDGVVEVREVFSESEANTLLKNDWRLLSVAERYAFKMVDTTVVQVSQGTWKFGRDSPQHAGVHSAITSQQETRSCAHQTQSHGSASERLRTIIVTQTWGRGKYGGEWCWAIESNGRRRPQVLDLILAIEASPGEKLVYENYEYTLSKKPTGKYPAKAFVRRRKVGLQ